MNIIVTACHVPFIGGGAHYHIEGLVGGLRQYGHRVELLRIPFQFEPVVSVRATMAFAGTLDLTQPNGQTVDRVISLQFPGYGITHPHHVAWVMHQYRAVYELFNPAEASPELTALRDEIKAYDNRALSGVRHCFANSPRVAERLREHNGVDAEPLLHPPPLVEHYRCNEAQPYIFCPSRLESLKRQDLLLEAAAKLKNPPGIVIAGDGGQAPRYRALAHKLGLDAHVRFLGHITEAEKIALYANALAVFFAPFDEDYGYITLEAMLAGKPVITCTDSGGPTAFVQEGVTGRVLPPDAQAIADALDALAKDPARSAQMGRNGREAYDALGLGWGRTIERLLSV